MSELPYTGATQRTRMPRAEIPGCALVQDLIPLYLDGEVTHESHVLMADHLQHCERCSGYLAGARTVRQQLLQDQNTIRAAMSSGPTVAQVAQPVAESLGARLWRILMALTWLGGLTMLFIGGMDNTQPLLLISGMALVVAIGGLLVVGARGSELWRVLSVLTGLLGGFFLLYSVVDPYSYRVNPMFVLSSALLIGVMAWCLWPSRTPSGKTQPLAGANRAVVTAMLSLIGLVVSGGLTLLGMIIVLDPAGNAPAHLQGLMMALLGASGVLLILFQRGLLQPWSAQTIAGMFSAIVCGLIALFGLFLLVATPPPDSDKIRAIPMVIGGVVGVLLINQRMGWRPTTSRHIVSILLILAGFLVSYFVLLSIFWPPALAAGLVGSVQYSVFGLIGVLLRNLPVIGLTIALLVIGSALAQRR